MTHKKYKKSRIAVVGAGFSGAVLARQLADHTDYDILVFENRDHIGGNCHTETDPETGVMVHRYGAHIFHTDNERVWTYLNRFGEFNNYQHRVIADTGRAVYTMPINLLTINAFFGKNMDPAEAREFIRDLGDSSIEEAKNFEEQALKFVGEDLYRAFFYGYTKKHWGIEPRELPASILKRIPIRFNYDDNYYHNPRYQGIPTDGYTEIVEKILKHKKIEVILNQEVNTKIKSEFNHVFWSGTIDSFFNYKIGRLGYRTVYWENKIESALGIGNSVINFTNMNVPYTRLIDHKYFIPQHKYEKSYVSVEFSKETGETDIPYYPISFGPNKELLAKYVDSANLEENVSFMGRLGTYRYLDMDVTIKEALEFADLCIIALKSGNRLPNFSYEL